LRRVGERLIEHFGELWNDRLRLARRDIELGVIGSKVSGYFSRVFGLVESILLESDCESLHWPRADSLHERDHQGRIDASG
jgi:hypothetical protein